jgi:hypothetical protein
MYRPNMAVEWVAFLLSVRQAKASNLGPETGWRDWDCGFHPNPQGSYLLMELSPS